MKSVIREACRMILALDMIALEGLGHNQLCTYKLEPIAILMRNYISCNILLIDIEDIHTIFRLKLSGFSTPVPAIIFMYSLHRQIRCICEPLPRLHVMWMASLL